MASGSENRSQGENQNHMEGENHQPQILLCTRNLSMTLPTLSIILKNRCHKHRMQAVERIFHDNTSSGYGWLLDGWIAEKRYVSSGRLYTYYYDQTGKMYTRKYQVLKILEDKYNTIILDF